MSKAITIVGVATPQANPTVEIEFRSLVRDPVHACFTRLTSRSAAPSDRLVAYLEQMPDALASFDTLTMAAFGFACTGSSYLVGAEQEAALTGSLSEKSGIPIVTATQAIRAELQRRDIKSIAILAPYPIALCEAATDYWQQQGVTVTATENIDIGADTRAIYELSDEHVAAAMARFDSKNAEVVLLSGTGMPTLTALENSGPAVLSSNLCLATELMRHAGHWPWNQNADIHSILR